MTRGTFGLRRQTRGGDGALTVPNSASSEPKRSRVSLALALLSLLRMNCDHESRLNGRCRASVLDCGSPLPLLRPRAGCESARGLAQSKISRCDGRFMESWADREFNLACRMVSRVNREKHTLRRAETMLEWAHNS